LKISYENKRTMEDTDNSRVEENMEEECENNTTVENEPSDDADKQSTDCISVTYHYQLCDGVDSYDLV